MPKSAHSSLTLSCAADSAAINRIFSSIEQISRHGIASLLLPCHSICYPSCRSILLPILPVCTRFPPPFVGGGLGWRTAVPRDPHALGVRAPGDVVIFCVRSASNELVRQISLDAWSGS